MRTRFVLAFALLVVGAATAHADVLKVGDRVAELDVAVDGDGKAFKLKNLKGKWVLMTVGASWCKPCAKELPVWDKLAGELKDKVTFIALNADNDPEAGKKFFAKLKIKNMTLVYLPADKSAVAERYGADTMPSTFVFDPKQIVKHRKDGFAERDPGGEYKKMKAALENLTR
ncbi:MAG TPA: TlpA disulfide reductase family protein [Kofleriaceae bacterium]|nr:TlpA disulfide reductase family protein [Kofleriaceae bacterium]